MPCIAVVVHKIIGLRILTVPGRSTTGFTYRTYNASRGGRRGPEGGGRKEEGNMRGMECVTITTANSFISSCFCPKLRKIVRYFDAPIAAKMFPE